MRARMRREARLPQSTDRRSPASLVGNVLSAERFTLRLSRLRQADFRDGPTDLRACAAEELARERNLHQVEAGRADDLLQEVVRALRVPGDASVHRRVEERLGLLRGCLGGGHE